MRGFHTAHPLTIQESNVNTEITNPAVLAMAVLLPNPEYHSAFPLCRETVGHQRVPVAIGLDELRRRGLVGMNHLYCSVGTGYERQGCSRVASPFRHSHVRKQNIDLLFGILERRWRPLRTSDI
jgi:hypothetical protein